MKLQFLVEIADESEKNVEYFRHLLGARAHHCKVVDVRYLQNESRFINEMAVKAEYIAYTKGEMEL